MKMTKQILMGVLALGAASSAYAAPVSVEFNNTSNWTIDHIYLSPTSVKDDWGPDQLGDKDTDIIKPGAKFTLNNINPNEYDMKLVDEDGDECVIPAVKLASGKVVDISTENLLGCQSETQASAESEE